MTQITDTLFVVIVPEDTAAYELRSSVHTDKGSLTFYDVFKGSEYPSLIQYIPRGMWKDLGLLSSITERQAAEFVHVNATAATERYSRPEDMTGWEAFKSASGLTAWRKIEKVYYRDYTRKQNGRSVGWVGDKDTTIESLYSLLQSKGVDTSKPENILLIQKLN